MDSKNYQISGKVIHIGQIQQIKEDFTKIEFVVDTDEKYPQKIKIEAIKDMCPKIAALNQGDYVNVFFNLRGRGYTAKDGSDAWFNSILCWKFELVNQTGKWSGEEIPEPPQGKYDDEDVPF